MHSNSPPPHQGARPPESRDPISWVRACRTIFLTLTSLVGLVAAVLKLF